MHQRKDIELCVKSLLEEGTRSECRFRLEEAVLEVPAVHTDRLDDELLREVKHILLNKLKQLLIICTLYGTMIMATEVEINFKRNVLWLVTHRELLSILIRPLIDMT